VVNKPADKRKIFTESTMPQGTNFSKNVFDTNADARSVCVS